MSTTDFDQHKHAVAELKGYLNNDDLALQDAVGLGSIAAWAAVQRQRGATFRVRVELAVVELAAAAALRPSARNNSR